MLNSNKSIDLKGLGYYIRFFYYIKPPNKFYRFDTNPNRKTLTQILLYCKIPLEILENRIAKALNKLGINKDLIESFCLEIKEQLKNVCYNLDLPTKKRKISATKKLAHIEKKSIFHITNSELETLSSESMDIGLLDFMYLYREVKSCKIIDEKSLFNGYKLTKLIYGNNLRIHQCRYSFNNLEWDTLHRTVRENNLSIWSPNAQSVMLIIASKQDKELCNMELLSEGFKQIAKRYTFFDTLRIVGLLRKKEVNVEIGNDVLSSEEEIRELGFDFLPKTYEIYGIKFWFDKSRKDGIELDFSFNCGLNDIIKAYKFIENLPYLIRIAKEIEVRKKLLDQYNKLKLEQKNNKVNEIQAFKITPKTDLSKCFRNDLEKEYKILNEINDLSILVIHKPIQYHYRTAKDS